MFQYYRGAFIFTLLALVGGGLLGGLEGAWLVFMLGVLETSLSFDNAVVNASVLTTWSQKWRRRFMVWGLPVAIVGTRILFPLLIVAVLGHMSLSEAVTMAFKNPGKYASVMQSAKPQISAYGGAFLLMVFLKFFVDDNKDHHWLHWIEAPLTRLGRFEAVQMVITLLALLTVTSLMPSEEQLTFLLSGIWGLVTYVCVDAVGTLMGGDAAEGAKRVVKEGIGGFIYLEILDTSFSFDGVIGAFALSTQILTIALGLGVGSVFVRAMTLHLVDKGTLTALRYLEHGAFWSIGALAGIMLISTQVEIPESVTGLIGAVSVGMAVWSSIRANHRDKLAAA